MISFIRTGNPSAFIWTATDNIEVQAPKGASDESILRLIEDKWDIIVEKVKERQDRLKGPQEKIYAHGEPFLYLGKAYPIDIHEDRSHHARSCHV